MTIHQGFVELAFIVGPLLMLQWLCSAREKP